MVSVPKVSMTRFSPTVRDFVPQTRIATTVSDAMESIADLASTKVDSEDVLNLLYRSLKVGSERKLENFNGERRITVYRGNGFMNKITQKLKEPCITFIKAMQNIGTEENPKLVTKSIILDVPNKKDALEIYYNEPGNSLAGVFINLYREDYQTLVRSFANLTELRNDPDIIRIVGPWLGK